MNAVDVTLFLLSVGIQLYLYVYESIPAQLNNPT